MSTIREGNISEPELTRSKWEVKHFVLAGVFGALTFAVAFSLGAGIILATGIPATGGIANIFASILIITLGMRIVPRFGFATLTTAIMFTMAVPTVIGGPPGAYKIVNGVMIGLVLDSFSLLLRRTNLSFIVAGAIASMVSLLCVYFALILLHLPGVDRLAPLIKFLLPIQGVNGALGARVANIIFHRRLKHISAVRRLLD